jgi:hypothetical protein
LGREELTCLLLSQCATTSRRDGTPTRRSR